MDCKLTTLSIVLACVIVAYFIFMFVVMKREKAIKDETDDTKALYRKIKMVAVLMFVVSIIVIGGLMLYCFYSRM